MHFSTLGDFLIFFVILFNIYLIKYQEEKLKKKYFLLLNGTDPGENGTPFFSATDGLNLLKDALVKRKFVSPSEVLSFYSFFWV